MASPRQGLDAATVAAARRRFGSNEISAAEHRGPLKTLRSILLEPMFVLLIIAAGLYLAMGDRAAGLLLSFFALVTIGLVVLQERRSERALDALRVLAAPQARAWRDGVVVRGHGVVELEVIGRQTQVGRIGVALATIDSAHAPMEQQLVRLFAAGAIAVSGALVAWYGLVLRDWLHGLLAGIALAMALLPEEFPMARRSSWPWGPGGSHAPRCGCAAPWRSTASARCRSCASTRPGR